MKKIALRLGLLGFGLVCGYTAIELGLRLLYPDGGLPAAHLQTFAPEVLASFHEDPECGYLPVPNTGDYGPQACVKNDYDVHHRRARRVLFVGDSVTHRGRIIRALEKEYGEASFEYWNAGVESFNTLQELVLYRRHNAVIEPDEVVLTFHNNDFTATPLVVREKGELKVYEPGMHVNEWLFKHSYVYRWVWPRTEHGDRADRAAQVRQSLLELRDLLAARKIRFTVIIFPILKPLSQWSEPEIWSRQTSLADFKDLGIRNFDMLDTLEKAIRDKIVVEESPGDSWHPSDQLSERFAQELKRQGLLDKGAHS